MVPSTPSCHEFFLCLIPFLAFQQDTHAFSISTTILLSTTHPCREPHARTRAWIGCSQDPLRIYKPLHTLKYLPEILKWQGTGSISQELQKSSFNLTHWSNIHRKSQNEISMDWLHAMVKYNGFS